MTTASTEFPMEHGVRLRGLAMTRIEMFADAAFAFAVTLLFISVDVPRSLDEMVIALKSRHRNWSRVYGLDDRAAIVLTLLLVVSLLVMVFPLRIVYGFGASDITNGWIPQPSPLESTLWTDQIRLIFIMLGVSWAWLAGIVVAMFAYVLKQRELLDLNDSEPCNANETEMPSA